MHKTRRGIRWYHAAMSSEPAAEPNAPPLDEGTPVSVKIRERLAAARRRFHANDNIAEFIEPGELELLLDEVEARTSSSSCARAGDKTSAPSSSPVTRVPIRSSSWLPWVFTCCTSRSIPRACRRCCADLSLPGLGHLTLRNKPYGRCAARGAGR